MAIAGMVPNTGLRPFRPLRARQLGFEKYFPKIVPPVFARVRDSTILELDLISVWWFGYQPRDIEVKHCVLCLR
jgi:hypothetical protein